MKKFSVPINLIDYNLALLKDVQDAITNGTLIYREDIQFRITAIMHDFKAIAEKGE